MDVFDHELGMVTDSAYDSLNDASEHDIMHAYYIYLDYFNEYGGHYEWELYSSFLSYWLLQTSAYH